MTTPNATPKPRAGEHTPETDAALNRIWSEPPDSGHYVPQRMIDLARSLEAERDRAQGELTLMKTAGIIEVSLRNPSVSEYINHWERRTEIAEAERDLLKERERELVAMLQVAAGELDHAGNALLNCSQSKLAEHALKAGAQASALLAKHGR